VFTYVYVKDAARAIVAAADRSGNERGDKYLVGNQRLRTAEYYRLVAEVSGTPAPRFEVPPWVAQAAARVGAWAGRAVTGRAPTAPPDLVRTAVSGNLLFDATKAQRELGLTYTPVRVAIEEAIAFIREGK
jgi:dihydroflavonol-4-reductase